MSQNDLQNTNHDDLPLILLIDDEKYIITALERELGQEHYQVMSYSNSRQALDASLTHEFSLIISDNMMPDLTGLELLSQVKMQYPMTRRILLTGHTNLDQAVQAFNEGTIHRFINKPWSKSEMLAAVQEELGTYRIQKREEITRMQLEHTSKDLTAQSKKTALELSQALTHVQKVEKLQENLFNLIPREVQNMLKSDPAALERGKNEEDVSVLFLDIEGSTKLLDNMETIEVDGLIEHYFSSYLNLIDENHGDITEIAGDGLMVIFKRGDRNLHALDAVKTALSIQEETQRIWKSAKSEHHCLKINIGISSGPALVGFTKYQAKSTTRLTFTADGRIVVIAARLEALATGGSILIDAETMQRIENTSEFAKINCEMEFIGSVTLKNINAPQQVYRLKPV